ncbi:hypothetical protein CDD82_934 [Ophiocordyceps australis]|uniref:CS domain-containing protein n=1 Tax=Ophiocordyceps australis TaxID=1399860 RepID=A0A2C5ZPL8_9HYPO|nr:hypothetical protein CDD82_934 [Ophiocordyceps australis]
MVEMVTPEVLWAQRSSVADASKNFIYLTISVPDIPKEGLQLDIKPASLTFTGTSGTLKRKYHVELEFYAEIDPAESKINHTSKNIEMKLQKKELKEEYWPRLLKDSKKLHFLKTDFEKWVDEDEQNEAAEEDFSQFGDMGGMPGMGGLDFSKLAGGAGGMPDMSAMGLDNMPDLSNMDGSAEDDNENNQDMPELEEANDKATGKD